MGKIKMLQLSSTVVSFQNRLKPVTFMTWKKLEEILMLFFIYGYKKSLSLNTNFPLFLEKMFGDKLEHVHGG